MCTPSQARAVAEAVVKNTSSNVCSIIVGTEVPIGALVGKPGVPNLTSMDLSAAETAFSPQDAAVLSVALRSPAAGQSLREMVLPLSLHEGFTTQQVGLA